MSLQSLPHAQALAGVDRVLADGLPFGDCDYLHQCSWRCYEGRLAMLAEHMPSSDALLGAVRRASPERRYRVLGDPVVRANVNDALMHYKLGQPQPDPDEMARVLSDAVGFLDEKRNDTPLTSAFRTHRRLGDPHYHGWLYTLDYESTEFSRGFESLWRRVTHLRPKEPTDQEHQALVDAARLLDVLHPSLARSALAHVQLVTLVDPPPRDSHR